MKTEGGGGVEERLIGPTEPLMNAFNRYLKSGIYMARGRGWVNA